MSDPIRRRTPAWRRYVRFWRSDVTADVDEELRFHLESAERDLRERGLDTDEARHQARARFGDVDSIATWLRSHDLAREHQQQRRERLHRLARHVALAFRSLRQRPAFTFAAVLTLALGIGATTAIFAVVDAVLLRPLPFAESERLMDLRFNSRAVTEGTLPQSRATYETYRRLARSLESIGVYSMEAVNLTAGAGSERVQVAEMTASVFDVLRLKPVAGRFFTSAEERVGHPPVVVIGDRIWQSEFDRSRDAIGRTLRIDGVPHEVIGVMPPSARYPNADVALWMPLVLDAPWTMPGPLNYPGVARLRAGITRETAAAELQSLLARVPELFPTAIPTMPMAKLLEMIALHVVVRPLRDEVVGDVGPVLWVIFGTAAFVLLAACANIANLCLARAESRQRELAVQMALGASRGDLLARFLAEGALIAGAGAILGAAVAALGLSALRASTSIPIPRLAEVAIDARALGVIVVITLVIALFTGGLPMLRFRTRDVTPMLRGGMRGATQGRDRRGMQRALVATQVGLAFVLLSSCALMARTFVELRQVRPGFDAEHSLTFKVSLPNAGYRDKVRVLAFRERMVARLAAISGVRAVGIGSRVPLEKDMVARTPIFVDGDQGATRDSPPARPMQIVSDEYFKAFAIPLVRGRVMGRTPLGAGEAEAVISATFADEVFHDATGTSAIGRRIRLLPTGAPFTVVGVVADVRDAGLDRAPPGWVYVPSGSTPFGAADTLMNRDLRVVVGTTIDPAAVMPQVRRALAELDASLPIYQLRSTRELVADSMARTSFTALLLGIASVVSLALGVIGLYGVVSYTVGARVREIGVRIALGAPPATVSRRYAREGALLASVGLVAGTVVTMLVTRAMRGLLFGVSATDPVTLVGAAAVLLVVAVGASWIPARRAARVDPASVLSSD